MRAVQAGAPLDTAFEHAMEECLQCRGCEAACPSGVPFGRLMEGARVALDDTRRTRRPILRRIGEWFGYRVVLPHRSVLRACTWVLLVAQRLHAVPRRFGLPRLLAREITPPLRGTAAPHVDAMLFPGCVMDAWQRDVHRAALRVMRATGAVVGLPGRGSDCCGALHVHAGRIEEARRLAARVITSVPPGVDVVVDSAGCGAAMKEYGHLLGTEEARAFSARVFDFAEWVEPRAPVLPRRGRPVVVQDPCHLRHVQHAEGAVRRLLGRSYEIIEMGDDGLCCGAGGAYALLQPELSREVRARKVAAIRAAGGVEPLVSSANPGCSMHLAAAGIVVRHPAQLVADLLPEDDDV